MAADPFETARLFSYGTLRQPEVQMATFGRLLIGRADVLEGFQLSSVIITDPGVIARSGKSVHPILRQTGDRRDQVEGVIFELTLAELSAADAYEVDDYVRVPTCSKAGVDTFVYIRGADALG